MVWFNIAISVILALVATFWARSFLCDLFALANPQAFGIGGAVALVVAITAFLAMHNGWPYYFLAMILLLSVAQIVREEAWAGWLVRVLLVGHVVGAIVNIINDISSGRWTWGAWVFSLLFWPLIEWLVYRLATFFSKEEDARRAEQQP